MIDDFELGYRQNQERPAISLFQSKDQRAPDLSAIDSISYSARLGVGGSLFGNVPPTTWPRESVLESRRRNSLALGGSEMSFPNPRRDSFGLGGDLGSFSAGSRRNSLALGLDLNFGDQQFSADLAALASQSLGNQSLLNPGGLGSTVNAQLQQLNALSGGPAANPQLHQLSAQLQGGNFPLQQQHQHLLQHQEQQRQQQAMAMVERSIEAQRVQAEAQAAAAALFFGGPLSSESEDSSPNSLGQMGRIDNFSVAGSQNLFGGGSLTSSLQSSQPLLQLPSSSTSGDMLRMSLNLAGTASGNVSWDSTLQPLNSFSQLQQMQMQQKQLQLLQSSLGSSTQPPEQQRQYIQSSLGSHQQLQQLQQLQLQRQLRQQEMRRHSLGMSFPLESLAATSQQQQQQQQQQQLELEELSLSEQLNLHQHQLESISGEDLLGAARKTRREDIASVPNKKQKLGHSKRSSSDKYQQSPAKGAASKKDASFPLKLHEILCNSEYQEMIAWMPHGKAWRILKPSAFENIVIPLHFRHCKYASFMRQVNGWGFQRVLHGNDHNSYKHDLFVRDQPELCKQMKRVGTVKKVMEGGDEADESKGKSKGGQKGSKKANLDVEHSSSAGNLTTGGIVNRTTEVGGNDPTSILLSAARAAQSNNLVAANENLGMNNCIPNLPDISFGQLFQDTSSLEIARNTMGLGELGSTQLQNLFKLPPAGRLSVTPPQEQQSLSSYSASGGRLDGVQQQVAMSGGFCQQTISTVAKSSGTGGLSGRSSLVPLEKSQGSGSGPSNVSQFQEGPNSHSEAARQQP